MASKFIGFKRALDLTMDNIEPLPAAETGLGEAVGRVAAADVMSKVDAPSSDISLKDGFALLSSNVDTAAPQNPICLKVLGTLGAGQDKAYLVASGCAVHILTGATIPPGADSVCADEYTNDRGEGVEVLAPTGEGRNILPQGSDVAVGQAVIKKGQIITPGLIGLLAAGGIDRIWAHPMPVVTLIASGDEVVPPGSELPPGKVYASNLMTLAAWCARFGMAARLDFVKDDPVDIRESIAKAVEQGDAVITIGGAWSSARDWMARVLEELGWRKLYHHVRMGPGKAVGFGLLQGKPVFALPGGPPSNLMSFLQLALPGILKLAGREEPPFMELDARLLRPERGQSDWTQFIYGNLEEVEGRRCFRPIKGISRLRRIALASAIAVIPEGQECIDSGDKIKVQMLS